METYSSVQIMYYRLTHNCAGQGTEEGREKTRRREVRRYGSRGGEEIGRDGKNKMRMRGKKR
jgi:hypothetical protein